VDRPDFGSMTGFLLDENLPANIPIDGEWRVLHATDLGLQPSDSALWTYAEKHQLAIVTKDADFRIRALTSTPPPWIVHLRIGNLRRKAFHNHLTKAWPLILSLLPIHRLVTVFPDRIEALK
jgi:predicted nuclease of predicted toxin-antitoxin system